MPATRDARVDAYIARSAPFARPILRRLRAAVHRACPAAVETIKWGFPNFEHRGPMCHMAAFKAHCAFGFHKPSLIAAPSGVLQRGKRDAMGHLGRIAKVGELPSAAALAALIRQAAALNEQGVKEPRIRARRAAIAPPRDFLAPLRASAGASATWKALPPSCRREYLEWIVEAKRSETRARRIATAIEWLGAGRRMNWRYESSTSTARRAVSSTGRARRAAAPARSR
jgi:hypothetical protein